MGNRALRWPAILILGCLTLGCATRFSPGTVRREIVRQRGVDPLQTECFLQKGRNVHVFIARDAEQSARR
jgi:hypothetical protein